MNQFRACNSKIPWWLFDYVPYADCASFFLFIFISIRSMDSLITFTLKKKKKSVLMPSRNSTFRYSYGNEMHFSFITINHDLLNVNGMKEFVWVCASACVYNVSILSWGHFQCSSSWWINTTILLKHFSINHLSQFGKQVSLLNSIQHSTFDKRFFFYDWCRASKSSTNCGFFFFSDVAMKNFWEFYFAANCPFVCMNANIANLSLFSILNVELTTI